MQHDRSHKHRGASATATPPKRKDKGQPALTTGKGQPALAHAMHLDLTVAHGISHFTPIRPTNHFVAGAGLAYVVARWQATGPGHTISLQWTMPGGLHGHFSPSCGGMCRVAWVEIPLIAPGTYRVAFILDGRVVSERRFSVGHAGPTTKQGSAA